MNEAADSLRRSRVLLSNNLPLSAHRETFFSEDFVYVSNFPSEHPRVIHFPRHSEFDVASLPLPEGWSPDVFIAKLDAFNKLVPRNVSALRCPKVLVLGATHYGSDPLNKMIDYAKSEHYDFYIVEHMRHHMWYYWLAGIKNLHWIPGLWHKPATADLLDAPYINPDFSRAVFEGRTVFIGQTGKSHPWRTLILERLKNAVPDLQSTLLPQNDSFKAYRAAGISLNISLNGDLNRRVFEVLSAGGFLLSDTLSDEAGAELLLEKGREYDTYSSFDELLMKVRHYASSPTASAGMRAQGHRRYLNEYTPERIETLVAKLVHGQPVEQRYTSASVSRIKYCKHTHYSKARIDIYQYIQELHRGVDNLKLLFDARVECSSPVDFLDLPRVHLTVTHATADYSDGLATYLQRSGNAARVCFAGNEAHAGKFEAVICPQHDGATQDHYGRRGSAVVSVDVEGKSIKFARGGIRSTRPAQQITFR